MCQPLRLSDELLLLGCRRLGVELLVEHPTDGYEGAGHTPPLLSPLSPPPPVIISTAHGLGP